MERITVFDGKFWAHKNFPPVKDDTVDEFVDCVKELAARLAAYEETGLEPEEIERVLDSYGRGMTLRTENAQRLEIIKEIPINRLRELAQAEKEGQLAVLPCKDWFEIVFGEQELFWGIDTDYIDTPIREISVDNAERFTWYDGWKTLVLRGNDENGLDWEFSPEDIGKTVFLTREAAEAALQNTLYKNDADNADLEGYKI